MFKYLPTLLTLTILSTSPLLMAATMDIRKPLMTGTLQTIPNANRAAVNDAQGELRVDPRTVELVISLRRAHTNLLAEKAVALSVEGASLELSEDFQSPVRIARLVVEAASGFLRDAHGEEDLNEFLKYLLDNQRALITELAEKIEKSWQDHEPLGSDILDLSVALDMVDASRGNNDPNAKVANIVHGTINDVLNDVSIGLLKQWDEHEGIGDDVEGDSGEEPSETHMESHPETSPVLVGVGSRKDLQGPSILTTPIAEGTPVELRDLSVNLVSVERPAPIETPIVASNWKDNIFTGAKIGVAVGAVFALAHFFPPLALLGYGTLAAGLALKAM